MGTTKDLSFWCCPATLQIFTWRNEATAQPTCVNELSQRLCEGGLGEAHPSTIIYTRVPGDDLANNYLRSLLESQCVCLKRQWSTTSLQSRAAGLGRAGKGEAGRGQGQQSFVVVFWRTGARPALWRGSQPCLPLWESMAWEHSSARGKGGDETSSWTLGSPCPFIFWGCK